MCWACAGHVGQLVAHLWTARVRREAALQRELDERQELCRRRGGLGLPRTGGTDCGHDQPQARAALRLLDLLGRGRLQGGQGAQHGAGLRGMRDAPPQRGRILRPLRLSPVRITPAQRHVSLRVRHARHEGAQGIDSGRNSVSRNFIAGKLFISLFTRRTHPEQPPPAPCERKTNVTQGPTKPPRQAAKAGRPERGGAQMSRLITRLSFCTRLSRKSPCLIVARYCAL